MQLVGSRLSHYWRSYRTPIHYRSHLLTACPCKSVRIQDPCDHASLHAYIIRMSLRQEAAHSPYTIK